MKKPAVRKGPGSFWIHGRDSPPGVLAIVVAMIVGSAGLEAARWWRDRVIVRGLEETAPS